MEGIECNWIKTRQVRLDQVDWIGVEQKESCREIRVEQEERSGVRRVEQSDQYRNIRVKRSEQIRAEKSESERR